MQTDDWIDRLDQKIATLTQERNALERRQLQFSTEKINALDEQQKRLDASWARFYELDADTEGRVVALMLDRDAAIARAEKAEAAIREREEDDLDHSHLCLLSRLFNQSANLRDINHLICEVWIKNEIERAAIRAARSGK
jgi:hypothetical protein